MTSINLEKMCIHFPELFLLLKCHENVVFFSKTAQNKVPLFPRKCPFCYVLFSDCPYFLNKILDQLHSNKLRNWNPNDKYPYTFLYLYLYIYIYPYISIYNIYNIYIIYIERVSYIYYIYIYIAYFLIINLLFYVTNLYLMCYLYIIC